MKYPDNIHSRFSLNRKIGILTSRAGLHGHLIATAVIRAQAKGSIASRDLEKVERATAEGRGEVRNGGGRVDVLESTAAARPRISYVDSVAEFAASMQINTTCVCSPFLGSNFLRPPGTRQSHTERGRFTGLRRVRIHRRCKPYNWRWILC